jgi:hypothetical protein
MGQRRILIVFAAIADVLKHVAPEAIVVVIIRIVFKLVTYAIDDENRWRRFMSLAAPLVALVLTLALVGVWWLLGNDGVNILLHDFGRR